MSASADTGGLVRLVALSALAAAALILPACSSGKDDERDDVNRYLRDANAVQREAAPRFRRANEAYLDFSRGDLAPREARKQLTAAERSIRDTRDELAQLDPPAPARELHGLLLALFDADADFARESTMLARYIPASSSALKPLSRLGRALRRGLGGEAQSPARQARALTAYAAGVGRVVDRLRPLKPPPVLFERHNREIRRLDEVRSLARRLSGALRAADSRAVARLLLRFRRASASAPDADAADAAGLRAYNRRYLDVRRAQQAVARERAKVVKSFE